MNMAGIDPKQQAILGAAWVAFSTYGFRKTSMDDIAKGAGMSRPALYLHFKNKEAIFRALVAAYYGNAAENVRAGLTSEGPMAERLLAAFEGQGGEAIESMLTSPHGLELFEITKSVAGEQIEKGEEALRGLYAAWLQQQAEAGQAVLNGDAAVIARTICASLKGIKQAAGDYATYQEGVRQLAALFGAGLAPR
ncbi:TetR/AcrR family transcriptional regulator [Leisingera methylohalidivorans]|uniref:TetR family transcriptional regulator n=1 Tax=Leisingera methylohalidivorans DSM 14336 TaxID=999552 RepID=V9VTN7_9RHOB|nr:TetR/AcrR family transcriptional regulator [Leisingera methylohalidivorans]AHD01363.1 TetR family transcriptional regulator [Leisingera methylohalidivorans DSM 14336]